MDTTIFIEYPLLALKWGADVNISNNNSEQAMLEKWPFLVTIFTVTEGTWTYDENKDHSRNIFRRNLSYNSYLWSLLTRTGFWPLSLYNMYIRHPCTSALILTLEKEIAYSAQLLISTDSNIQYHNSDNHNLSTHCCENLRTYTKSFNFIWDQLNILECTATCIAQEVNTSFVQQLLWGNTQGQVLFTEC